MALAKISRELRRRKHKSLSTFCVSCCLILLSLPLSAFAENKIIAVVNSNGRVVFTNINDDTPMPAANAQLVDTLADEMPAALRALVDTISRNHGVDPALVRAVIKTESNFNRFAVSNKGALGLMQLIPDTGKRYGVRDFFDPQQNVDGGVRYLRFLLDKFNGNLDLSLAAYNAGENLVERLGRVPPIPETTTYVRKVRTFYKQGPKLQAAASASTTAVAAKEEPAKQEAPKPEASKIYKVVDGRGVVHFSNVEN
jgi:soluble lytic murein transglycosylase-like protein